MMIRRPAARRASPGSRAFTLIELLVASIVLIMLLGIILAVTGGAGTTIGRTTARLDAFAAARSAFDLVSGRLGQATLNPYYETLDARGRPLSDPYYTTGTGTAFVPARYGRQSDLQFLVQANTQNPGYGQEAFFAAPLGYSGGPDTQATPGLLNACGFFVQYGSDAAFLPATVTVPRVRYRLMQAIQPTERLQIYPSTAQGNAYWLTDLANANQPVSRYLSPLADNVLVLTIWPRLPENADPAGSQLTADYTYDSRAAAADPGLSGQPATAHQLPPTVQLTMVVLSEASVIRLASAPGQPPAVTENALLNADGSHKFGVSTTAQQQADLRDLSARLTQAHVDFEIFTTSVPMREPRWGIQSNP